MRLQPGTRLLRYEILAPLGQGGMGEVYRARDTSVGREVAVKILPDAVARDPASRARLEREARLLASLLHPNVETLFALEEADGAPFLVLELVAGRTLAERLSAGALPWREAATLFRQIASGLEAAHEKEIIHLDLKPANVKVTPDGQAKILDFGIARAVARSAFDPEGETRTRADLPSGGTAPYMSPEQARGLEVDARADVWAFGATLYEALTGRRTFTGATRADVLAAVLERDPDWSALPSNLAPSIRRLLGRCLRRDPTQRLHHMADARLEIEDALAEGPGGPLPPPRRRARRAALVVLAAASLLAAGAVVGWRAGRGATGRGAPPIRRFSIEARPDARAALSPDGARLAWTRGGRLVVRELDRLDSRELPGTDGASGLVWSPDGRQIAFPAAGRLARVTVDGGLPVVVGDLPPNAAFVGGAWSPSGTIVVALGPGLGLFSIPATGGSLSTLLRPDAARGIFDLHMPSFLPDGRSLLLVAHMQTGAEFRPAVLRDGALRLLSLGERIGGVGSLTLAPDGRTLLVQRVSGGLSVFAVPVSLPDLRPTGQPVLVAERASSPTVSRDGTLAYVSGRSGLCDLVVADRSGRVTRVVTRDREAVRFPRVSPDGARVATTEMRDGNWDVWVRDIAGGTSSRLTSGRELDTTGAWSPDGDRLLLTSGLVSDAELRTMRADGGGEPVGTGLHASGLPEGNEVSPDWSPDGRHVAFRSGGDLFWAALGRSATAVPFVHSPFLESEPRFSPDGRYVAYTSNQTGRDEVYVRPFPSGEARWTVSTRGGVLPRWSGRGDEVFYVEGRTIVSVPVSTKGPSFRAGAPRALFDTAAASLRAWSFSPLNASYDPLPDGSGFVLVRGEADAPESIVVVEGWAASLSRR